MNLANGLGLALALRLTFIFLQNMTLYVNKKNVHYLKKYIFYGVFLMSHTCEGSLFGMRG